MFCDLAQITVIAGRGGDGAVSFLRQKYMPNGGPDGGNGGCGGSIIFRAVDNINTLSDFRTRKVFKAELGESGAKCNRHGSDAVDLILEVPVGTVISGTEARYDDLSDEEQANANQSVLVDLKEVGEEWVAVDGGKGGKGNAGFVSSVRQAPGFAEKGEPGQVRELTLELKLVADVGIIGMPSAGKSTLISRISAAKPKIAEYHFTTLVPNLGVVDMSQFGGGEGESFVVIDIPGLIEGAAFGKGLGDEFLRHVTRAQFLVHLLDGNLDEIVENYQVINKELAQYSEELAKKEQVLVINKIDLLDTELSSFLIEQLEKVDVNVKGKIHLISAVSGEGINDLVWRLWERVKELRTEDREFKADAFRKDELAKEQSEEHVLYQPHLERGQKDFRIHLLGEENLDADEYLVPKTRKSSKERFKERRERRERKISGESLEAPDVDEPVVIKKRRIFAVEQERLEQIVIMTEMNNEQAVDRIYDVMKKMGINNGLSRQGAKSGDKVIIAGRTLKFREV